MTSDTTPLLNVRVAIKNMSYMWPVGMRDACGCVPFFFFLKIHLFFSLQALTARKDEHDVRREPPVKLGLAFISKKK